MSKIAETARGFKVYGLQDTPQARARPNEGAPDRGPRGVFPSTPVV